MLQRTCEIITYRIPCPSMIDCHNRLSIGRASQQDFQFTFPPSYPDQPSRLYKIWIFLLSPPLIFYVVDLQVTLNLVTTLSDPFLRRIANIRKIRQETPDRIVRIQLCLDSLLASSSVSIATVAPRRIAVPEFSDGSAKSATP